MTEALYHTDAYLREFDALVTAVDGNKVVLDRTAFYPGGGGQPNDVGWLSAHDQNWVVTKVKKQGDDIWHELDGEPPTVGTVVFGQIDWERRYQLMRTHTAMHILCGVIFRDYGASVTGGNMEPLSARMDFELDPTPEGFGARVEELVAAELVAELGLAQGRVSSHLACLRWCGYVEGSVEGRFSRYRLVDERIREILALGEAVVHDNAERLTSCLVLATESDS